MAAPAAEPRPHPVARRLLAPHDAYERLPRPVRLVAVLGWMGVIWWASSRSPDRTLPRLGSSFVSNGLHVVVFGLLALLVHAVATGMAARPRAVVAVLTAALYGVVDEWHQSYTPGRHVDPWDVCSDLTGAVLAVAMLRWLQGHPGPGGRIACLAGLLALASVWMASR